MPIEEIIEDIPAEDKAKMYVNFNEDNTYGFYTPGIHGEEIAEDKSYIPITDEAYHELINNQGLKMLGELSEDVTEIGVEHLVEVPEQEPAPPTVRELVLQQKDLAIKLIVPTLPDEAILQVPLLVDEWSGDGIQYVAERDVVRFEEGLYRVTMSHTSQSDWSPNRALTLFNRISNQDDIEEWKAGNSYAKGTKVTHNGFTWESVVDNNVWEPGADGVNETIWKKIF